MTVIIGAEFNSPPGAKDAGHARVFRYDSNADVWNPLGDDIDGEAADDNSVTCAMG
jgi:hypothetical protein